MIENSLKEFERVEYMRLETIEDVTAFIEGIWIRAKKVSLDNN